MNPSAGLETASNDTGNMAEEASAQYCAKQACNECRRRKAKCDRVLPVCCQCTMSWRKCLYEYRARTPLTRHNMNELEAQLHRSQELLRRILPEYHRLKKQSRSSDTYEESPQSDEFDGLASNSDTDRDSFGLETAGLGPEPDLSVIPEGLECTSEDGFEFDENDGAVDTLCNEYDVLTIDDGSHGYRGIASGSTLLRLIRTFTQEPALDSDSKGTVSSTDEHMLYGPHIKSIPREVFERCIDNYFATYHVSYPIVHEGTFRAQYSGVIEQPKVGWTMLKYIVAALGAFSVARDAHDKLDIALFNLAKEQFDVSLMEKGSLTLVQALTLMSNYLQKRNKSNSGYNYLGLTLRMAMAIGLHKAFSPTHYKGSPLSSEIRRRVWWCLYVFDAGSTIFFGRPLGFPERATEICMPLNVHDAEFTALMKEPPTADVDAPTVYTNVRMQSIFHLMSNKMYERVTRVKDLPPAGEIVALDDQFCTAWDSRLPDYWKAEATVDEMYAMSHAVLHWRVMNFRLLLHRPAFIFRMLHLIKTKPAQRDDGTDPEYTSFVRCVQIALDTIKSIYEYTERHRRTRLSCWYAHFFLFQAALIPIVCYRNMVSLDGINWGQYMKMARDVFEKMQDMDAQAPRALKAIDVLTHNSLLGSFSPSQMDQMQIPVMADEHSPQSRMAFVLPMFYPTVSAPEMSSSGWPNSIGPAFGGPLMRDDTASLDMCQDFFDETVHTTSEAGAMRNEGPRGGNENLLYMQSFGPPDEMRSNGHP